jgi:uncharacterized OB-fold protein
MPHLPVRRDDASAEFFDGAAAGQFLLVRDRVSGRVFGPEFDRSVDPDRFVPEPSAGTGRIVSWSVVHQRRPDGSTHRVVVGIVEVDPGAGLGGHDDAPWWWTEIVDADPDADLHGAPVEVVFTRVGSQDDEVQPAFRMAAG